MNDTAQETTAVMATLVEQEMLAISLQPITKKGEKFAVHITSYASFIKHVILLYLHVGTAVPLGIGVIILHSTWEGSGLHLPSLPHVAL